MARFEYTARNTAGATVTAAIEAPTRRDALRLLAARNLQPVRVEEMSGAGPRKREKAATPAAGAPLSRKNERLPFLEALHDLTVSGLSAGEAVRLLSVRIKDPRLKALSGKLWEQIGEGVPLSRAMEGFPDTFDTGIVNLIKAGEATGSLNETLDRLIIHLKEQKEMRRQLATALAYPLLMVCVATGVILFFLFFLLPRLESLLNSLGGELPLSTQILVSISYFAIHYGIFFVIAAIFGGISFWRWRSTEAGRATTDAWLLKVPMVGPFIVAQTVLSFSQTLGVLLENGITAAEALQMTERQIENRVHRKAFSEATARVLEGEALSSALARTECFPDLVLDRLAVGENTGNVAPSLKDIGRTYQKVITDQLNFFTKVFASGVLMLVFVVVGFIAFAIVNAIFTASSAFKLG
jgi:type II secretory pathway component PulF